MTRFLPYVFILVLCLAAGGCAHPGQNTYDYTEVGKTSMVNFGTVLSVREVNVKGQNTGIGALAGGAAGGAIGNQIGAGTGNSLATAGGAVAGVVAGALIEQAISDRKALEFTVTLETGATITVVQDHNDGEAMIAPGDRVMVQLSGGTQRVLPAAGFPTEIKRPKGIKVVD